MEYTYWTLPENSLTFERVQTNQQNQIEESLSQAKNIVKQAQSDLSNSSESNRSNARRYREWFGEYQNKTSIK